MTPFVRSLPSLFAFLHGALDQLQRDTVNFHLSQIAPKVLGDDGGAAYERLRLDRKLAAGVTSLQKTELWISASVEAFCAQEAAEVKPAGGGAAASDGGVGGSSAAKGVGFPLGYAARKAALSSPSAVGHGPALKALLAFAVVELLAKPVRWDGPEAPHLIPETLVFDAMRLAKARDVIDRVVLVSTLLVILRQVLARRAMRRACRCARFSVSVFQNAWLCVAASVHFTLPPCGNPTPSCHLHHLSSALRAP